MAGTVEPPDGLAALRRALMRLFHGNVVKSAERAGMTREYLYRVLKKYDVRSEAYRDQAVDGGYSN